MKLTKSLDDYAVAGVLGGLSEYLGWSSTLLRVVFAILTIFTAAFPGITIYIILAILMPKPEEPKRFDIEDFRVQ